jgi:hypothetical protein
MILASLVATQLSSAFQAFNILLQIGAGTGLVFILRWFWYRINAWSEISGMAISFIVAIYFQVFYQGDMASWEKLLWGVIVTTAGWVTITLLTRPEKDAVLDQFYTRVRPHPMGWRKWLKKNNRVVVRYGDEGGFGLEMTAMLLGCLMVYGYLFGLGYTIYGNTMALVVSFTVALISTFALYKIWPRLTFS